MTHARTPTIPAHYAVGTWWESSSADPIPPGTSYIDEDGMRRPILETLEPHEWLFPLRGRGTWFRLSWSDCAGALDARRRAEERARSATTR